MAQASHAAEGAIDPRAVVTDLATRGQAAMACLKDADQARVDEAVTALAWSIYRDDRARTLAEKAVEDTDLGNAAAKIAVSRCFDNATSCSSENALVILDAVYEEAIGALQRAGAHRASEAEVGRVVATLWQNGKLNRHFINITHLVTTIPEDKPEEVELFGAFWDKYGPS